MISNAIYEWFSYDEQDYWYDCFIIEFHWMEITCILKYQTKKEFFLIFSVKRDFLSF